MRSGYTYQLESETQVAATAEEVFSFLSDPGSLPLLDPPWLKVQLLSATSGKFCAGSEMEYIFRWSEIPVYLRMVVTEVEPPLKLVWSQAQGPWQSFHHSMTLEPVRDGTLITERFQFETAPDLFGSLLHRWVIRRQFRDVIGFRKQALIDRLSRSVREQELDRVQR
jgi:ligand-binding SRPBCC domain-containing protein